MSLPAGSLKLPDTAAKGETPDRFTESVRRALREGAVILTGAVALMLFVALLSYHPDDPGFSYTGSGTADINNLIGLQGAWLADTLFFLFGGPAYLLPAMLAAACWLMFRRRNAPEQASRLNTFVRAGGFVLLLWPESAIGPSFQMSFAAVLAIILSVKNIAPADKRPDRRLG